ncbi:MAG TPA: hypothetical protein VFV99_00190, partial [Kofleriaceae bacterium]|nr:hypothetical protein [Kofleriaceae bacterium]
MPLAGSIKLRSFLAIIVGIGCAGVFLLFKACKSSEPPPKPADVVVKPKPEPTPTPTPPEPTPQQPSGQEMAARAWDADVIAWSKKTISGDKQKDVSKKKPYKINVYREAGHATVNRAKVDINRNDKWDEKYTFDGDTITLEIAPADDENYTKTYHWTGSAWLPEGATPTAEQGSAPNPDTAAKPDTPKPDNGGAKIDLPARTYDAEVIAWKDKSIASDKEKDVSKGKSYKINVYKDAGQT